MIVNEYGIIYYLGTSFDMSAYTALILTFTKPDGTTLVVQNPDVSIVAAPVTTTKGVFAANTYFKYTFQDGDIDQAGTWTVRGTYRESPTVQLFSTVDTFVVSE